MGRTAAFSPGPSASGTLRPSWAQLGRAGPSGLLVWENPPQGPAGGLAQGGLRKECVGFGGARDLLEHGRRRAWTLPCTGRLAVSEVARPSDDIVSGAAEGRGAGWCPEVNKAASAGEAAPGFRAREAGQPVCAMAEQAVGREESRLTLGCVFVLLRHTGSEIRFVMLGD